MIVAIGLAAAALVYGAGYRRLRRARPAAVRRALAFVAGLLALAIALLSPLDTVAESVLAAHMIQHLLLIVVAAPLLVAGRPVVTALAGLPSPVRRTVRRARTVAGAAGLTRGLRRPAVAWVLLTLTLWAWHAPTPFSAALDHPMLHAVEHACFLLTSMLGWSVAMHARGRFALGALGRALFLVATAAQGGLLGAVLLFASAPLYPAGGSARWGLTHLEDQQLAGALMWIPPSVVYLIAAAAILFGSLRALEPRMGASRAGTEVAS